MPGGRPPKPAALKALQGNPGKRKPKAEPQPAAVESLAAPEYLGAIAREEWCRVAPEVSRLGLLTLVDVAGLAGYCQAYARWRDAIKAVNESSSLGEAIARGFVRAEKEALAQMIQVAQQFGFTPSSRAKVAGAGKPADDADPLREFELHQGGRR